MSSTSDTKQDVPTMSVPEPQEEHRWLQKLIGEWTFESEAVMEPGKPPEKVTGRETVRALGGLWIIGEGEMGEEPHLSILTVGYDPQKRRFVGTWVGSMMNHLWVYDGALEGNVLTLDCEGPSMAGDGTMAKYQDIHELKSDDHRVLKSRVLGDDGKWTEFMTSNYRRTK